MKFIEGWSFFSPTHPCHPGATAGIQSRFPPLSHVITGLRRMRGSFSLSLRVRQADVAISCPTPTSCHPGAASGLVLERFLGEIQLHHFGHLHSGGYPGGVPVKAINFPRVLFFKGGGLRLQKVILTRIVLIPPGLEPFIFNRVGEVPGPRL